MNKNDLRARTVGAPKAYRNEMVDLGDGATVFVRQPSIEVRSQIMALAQPDPGKPPNFAMLQTEAVIQCTFVDDSPEAERLFTDADRDSLLSQPTGGWADQIIQAAMRAFNVDTEELKKKSPAAQSAGSSSS